MTVSLTMKNYSRNKIGIDLCHRATTVWVRFVLASMCLHVQNTEQYFRSPHLSFELVSQRPIGTVGHIEQEILMFPQKSSPSPTTLLFCFFSLLLLLFFMHNVHTKLLTKGFSNVVWKNSCPSRDGDIYFWIPNPACPLGVGPFIARFEAIPRFLNGSKQYL